MVGVRRMPGLAGRKHQAVLPEQCIKAVPPRHEPGSKKHGEHNPQFVTAYTRIFDTDITDSIQHETFPMYLTLNVSLWLVVGLTTMAKQTAGQRNFQVALTDQFRYDLAPDFFLIGMLKSSSARVIINSRASVSSLEKDRAFSSSLMRFFNWAFSSL